MKKGLKIILLVVSIIETLLLAPLGITPLVLSVLLQNIAVEKQKKMTIWIVVLEFIALAVILYAAIYVYTTTLPLSK